MLNSFWGFGTSFGPVKSSSGNVPHWIHVQAMIFIFSGIKLWQRKVFPISHECDEFLAKAAALLFTCGPGVFQGVLRTDGVSSLGGTSNSSLVNSTNPELVQTPFLEPKYWVVAHFLNAHIATHPLPLTDIISGKEVTKVIDLVRRQIQKFMFK